MRKANRCVFTASAPYLLDIMSQMVVIAMSDEMVEHLRKAGQVHTQIERGHFY